MRPENRSPRSNRSGMLARHRGTTYGKSSPTRGTGIGGPTMDIAHDGHVLVLAGDFDVRSTMEVRSAIYEHLAGFEQDLVVDLTGVTTLDLTAARVLAYASLEAGRSGHHLRLRGCGP